MREVVLDLSAIEKRVAHGSRWTPRQVAEDRASLWAEVKRLRERLAAAEADRDECGY